MIDPAQWSVTHGGKTFTVNSFMELVRAAQNLRTPEEKLQGAMRVMKAVDAMLEEPHPIEGLGSITDEDGGFITLRFKDEDAAQLFMQEYHPTVEANDMPPWPDDQPTASAYDNMLRAFCCKYSAGGWNSDGLLDPKVALGKLEWIVEDASRHTWTEAKKNELQSVLSRFKGAAPAMGKELPPHRELMALLGMSANDDLHDIMAMAVLRIKRLTDVPSVAEWVNDEQGFQRLTETKLPEGTQLYAKPE